MISQRGTGHLCANPVESVPSPSLWSPDQTEGRTDDLKVLSHTEGCLRPEWGCAVGTLPETIPEAWRTGTLGTSEWIFQSLQATIRPP